METSPPHGTSSCNRLRSREDSERALAEIAAGHAVATLKSILAPCELYIVGGAVRDVCCGVEVTDLDLATNLSAAEIKARCDAHKIKIVETGIQHGTVLAVVDGTHVEITTYRQPSERERHTTAPDITTDLSGRDFTINALAFDTHTNSLLDPFGGLKDIEQSTLRAVGDPTRRFTEDPHRVLRMVRFGDAQGRTIEAATLNAAVATVPLLARVSAERIRSELEKILLSAAPDAGVRLLNTIGALPYTIPELIPAVGFEQNRFHIHDVFEHTLWVLKRAPADKVLRWAAIFHDVGKPHTLSVDADGNRHFYLHELRSEDLSKVRLEALKFSHRDQTAITTIVRHHMRPLDCGPSGVRRLMRDLGSELPRWRQFKEADAPPTMPAEEFTAIAHRFDELLAAEQVRAAGPAYGKLAVTGDDLKKIGLQPGKEMGRILKELEEVVLDNPAANTFDTLVAEAKKRIRL